MNTSSEDNNKPKLLYKVLCNTIDERNILFEILHNPIHQLINEYLKEEPTTFLIYDNRTVIGVVFKYINENVLSVEEYKKIITMEKERTAIISLELALDMYKSDNSILRDMALKTFPELPEILEQSKYPKSWDELCRKKHGQSGVCISTSAEINTCYYQLGKCFKNTVSTEERAYKLLLLGQLLELRDEWNKIDEFTPDWNDLNLKYAVEGYFGYLQVEMCQNNSQLFTFKTHKIAQEFMKTFKTELEKVLSI